MTLRDFLPSPERPGVVLAVDDHALNHQLLARQLQGAPFHLTRADGPLQALELCRAQVFEAILSDVSMPGMDGLEFCRQLQATPNARTPLIFLSAVRADDASVSTWMELGALDYLSKPYVHAELLAKLRVMVRLSRQQAALAERQREEAMVEVAGGAAHELSQPLSAAMILLDRMERQHGAPSPEQMAQLRELLERTGSILNQITGLRAFVTKPYATGRILDIEKSREASGSHAGYEPKKRGSE